MSVHCDKRLMPLLERQTAELRELLLEHGGDGAIMCGVATPTDDNQVEVSHLGGASVPGCRMGLVMTLLDAMLQDPTTPPKTLDDCRRVFEVLRVPLPTATRRTLQ